MSLLEHPSKPWIYCVSSGAGAGLQAELWEVPGASAYLAGGSFPYATYETDRFLGYQPESYCSPAEAVELAMEAYCRACESRPDGRMPIGLAVTASVASLREHRGDHRVHAAIVTPEEALLRSAIFEKGVDARLRARDEHTVNTVALGLLNNNVLHDSGKEWSPKDPRPYRITDAELRRLFFAHPYFGWNGRREKELPFKKEVVLLPGTFNPIHDGHREMAIAVFHRTKKPVCYMITADSPHKATLSVQELLARAAMFRRERREAIGTQVLFTEGDPLYIHKARRFPGIGFAIGADAALRMLDPEWGPPIVPMMQEFYDLRTRFYVFRRLMSGAFLGWQHVHARCLSLGVSETYQRVFVPMNNTISEISSTEIREGTR